MAKRIELRIGEVVNVGGVPVALAYTQGKLAAVVAAEFDDEGTVDPPSTLLTAASQWRRRFDRRDKSSKDESNSGSV